MSNGIVDSLEKIGTAFDVFQKSQERWRAGIEERLELNEAQADRPRAPGGERADGITKQDIEHKTVFCEWLRQPKDIRYTGRLLDAQRELGIDAKDVSLASGAAGAFALPKEIDTQIIRRVAQLNPFRGLVYNPTASSSDYHTLVDLGDSTSGWAGETTSRTGTSTPTLRDRQPTWGEVYAYPTATNWSLQDVFFDVQKWLVDSASEQFASAETTAIVSGNGSNKPTGFLNTTPSSSGDDSSPIRSVNAFQYVPYGSYSSPAIFTGDSLIDLQSAIKEKYLVDSAACAWVMTNATLAKIRKLKNTTGDFIYQDSLVAGTPSTILGFPVRLTAAMPAASAGLYPIAFGNWNHGYVLADRPGLAITVDEVTSPGWTKFYIRRRVSGCIRNNDAVKLLKWSIS